MTGRINPCSRCLIEKCIISKVDDDPRDEIINTINISQVEEESKRLQKLILKKRKEYWSSLTTKKCIQTSKTSKPIVYKLNNKNVQKKLWNTNRLNELSKPRFDYYECTLFFQVYCFIISKCINGILTTYTYYTTGLYTIIYRKRACNVLYIIMCIVYYAQERKSLGVDFDA
eukprot:XP_016663141.1 PREDICTED: uncharacterized protein LOC100571633 isoform X4 [Acyrthosiphon pisum]